MSWVLTDYHNIIEVQQNTKCHNDDTVAENMYTKISKQVSVLVYLFTK